MDINILQMILNAAKEDGLIRINPAKSKRLRNLSTKKTIREALTSNEADDIESHLQDMIMTNMMDFEPMRNESPLAKNSFPSI